MALLGNSSYVPKWMAENTGRSGMEVARFSLCFRPCATNDSPTKATGR